MSKGSGKKDAMGVEHVQQDSSNKVYSELKDQKKSLVLIELQTTKVHNITDLFMHYSFEKFLMLEQAP